MSFPLCSLLCMLTVLEPPIPLSPPIPLAPISQPSSSKSVSIPSVCLSLCLTVYPSIFSCSEPALTLTLGSWSLSWLLCLLFSCHRPCNPMKSPDFSIFQVPSFTQLPYCLHPASFGGSRQTTVSLAPDWAIGPQGEKPRCLCTLGSQTFGSTCARRGSRSPRVPGSQGLAQGCLKPGGCSVTPASTSLSQASCKATDAISKPGPL